MDRNLEDRIAQLFDVLDDLNWHGDFCDECGKLTYGIKECADCCNPVCTKCVDLHECGSGEDSGDDSA